MPKQDPKQIQKELEQGIVWPVYWIYGPETMKSREVLKKIKATVCGEGASEGGQNSFFSEEIFDGAQVKVAEILDAAQSLSLGGGVKWVVVRDAHALKEQELLAELFGKKGKKEELSSVCVFLSKDLDGRKKFSKQLIEKAAVVFCEEIFEADRGAWIQYLAKKKGLSLSQELLAQLGTLDPWSLDLMERELEKLELLPQDSAVQKGNPHERGGEAFLEAFLSRDLTRALSLLKSFSESPEESLPLLGLLAWNVRHLALLQADRAQGSRSLKINPYVLERLQKWLKFWSLSELLRLQAALEDLDFGVKQTFRVPLGLWGDLTMRFCQTEH